MKHKKIEVPYPDLLISIPGWPRHFWSQELSLPIRKRGDNFYVCSPYKKSKYGGHTAVSLYNNGRKKNYTTNRLALMAKTGTEKFGYDSHHIDGNPKNNSLNNLVWMEKHAHRSKSFKTEGDPF